MPAGLLLAAAAPMNLGRQHAIFVLDQTAHPHHGGDLIFGHADALAAQILRLLYPGSHADIDSGMPENARHESRNANIGCVARRDCAGVT